MTAISLLLFVFYPSLQWRRSRQDAKMPDFCAIVYLRSKAYCLMGLEAFFASASVDLILQQNYLMRYPFSD
jgi:hypothetical protein